MGRLPGRGGLRPSRASLVAASLVLAAGLGGCGAAERAGDRIEQEAQEQVDAAVDRAADEAAERIEQELAEQGVIAQDEAQGLLDSALDELQQSGASCTGYSDQPEAQRQEQMGSLLRAFWLAELETSAPGAEAVAAFTAEVDSRCSAAPDTAVATAAREAYAAGGFGPTSG